MTLKLIPYVTFDGTCEAAMTFYAEALNGTLTLMRFGDSPMPVPEEAKGKIMHSTLHFGDATLFASDGMPGTKVATASNIALSVAAPDAASGAKTFEALAAGGTITMPFATQFWGDTFGMLVDKFGNRWMVNATPTKD